MDWLILYLFGGWLCGGVFYQLCHDAGEPDWGDALVLLFVMAVWPIGLLAWIAVELS